jgi:hypothetical protein
MSRAKPGGIVLKGAFVDQDARQAFTAGTDRDIAET